MGAFEMHNKQTSHIKLKEKNYNINNIQIANRARPISRVIFIAWPTLGLHTFENIISNINTQIYPEHFEDSLMFGKKNDAMATNNNKNSSGSTQNSNVLSQKLFQLTAVFG